MTTAFCAKQLDHVHTWSADHSRAKFTCPCGVQGHAAKIIPGQLRGRTSKITPYACRFRDHDRRYCGAEAVYVPGDRQMSRCREHVAGSVAA